MAENYENAPVPEMQGPARRAAMLKELESVVCQNRVADYSDPEDSFGDIAKFWNIYLGDRIGKKINARDVAFMQVLLKLARLKANPNHSDSMLDVAGYAICARGLDDVK